MDDTFTLLVQDLKLGGEWTTYTDHPTFNSRKELSDWAWEFVSNSEYLSDYKIITSKSTLVFTWICSNGHNNSCTLYCDNNDVIPDDDDDYALSVCSDPGFIRDNTCSTCSDANHIDVDWNFI